VFPFPVSGIVFELGAGFDRLGEHVHEPATLGASAFPFPVSGIVFELGAGFDGLGEHVHERGHAARDRV
jgi:hypothetical protein